MFKNTFQSGFLSILYSIGSKPLQIWDKKVRNGHIKRITDNDIQSLVLEIEGTNVSTTYITCPADPKKTLGIKLPFLVMIIKNLKKYFTFEVQVLDDKNVRRRFRASNYQSTTRVKPFICTMPMRLDDGWNQIQFNLSDFTRRAYGTNYIETLRVQIHANCRIRRVYFSDRLYSEDELPAEFKLYLPVQNKAKVRCPSLRKPGVGMGSHGLGLALHQKLAWLGYHWRLAIALVLLIAWQRQVRGELWTVLCLMPPQCIAPFVSRLPISCSQFFLEEYPPCDPWSASEAAEQAVDSCGHVGVRSGISRSS